MQLSCDSAGKLNSFLQRGGAPEDHTDGAIALPTSQFPYEIRIITQHNYSRALGLGLGRRFVQRVSSLYKCNVDSIEFAARSRLALHLNIISPVTKCMYVCPGGPCLMVWCSQVSDRRGLDSLEKRRIPDSVRLASPRW